MQDQSEPTPPDRGRKTPQALLTSLTDAARSSRDPRKILEDIQSSVCGHFEVTRCTYGNFDQDDLHVIVDRDFTTGSTSAIGRHRAEDFGADLLRDLKAGTTVAIDDVASDPRTHATSHQAAFAAIEARALLVVPLVKEGRLVSAFVLTHRDIRHWSAEDIALMEQVAERTWFVIEQARAENSLRESQDVLALAMRGGRMGAWSRDLATNRVWWSRELEELFGLPPGGFVGTEQGFFDFVHPDDRRAFEHAVTTAIANGDDYVAEFRFRHANGTWRWMEGRGRAVYADDGSPRSLYGLGIDITERRSVQEALVSALDSAGADAQRLNLALDAARLGDWSWNAETDIVTFSPRAAELFDIPPGPYMTWTAMRDILHHDDRERAREAVETALSTHSDYRIEYRLINGRRERWISASGRGRYDEAGRVLGMFGVVQDITRDRLLVRLDAELRLVVDPDSATFTAAQFLGQHLRVNRCAYAIVEADEDTFVLTGNYTLDVPSIVGRYTFRQFGVRCLELMRAGEPFVVGDVLTDPRLDELDRVAYELTTICSVICVPIRKAGRLVAAMAVHGTAPRDWQPEEVDIVQQVANRCWESLERVRIERERAGLLDAAEAANRAKDEFLAMLGHELRNPLSPILTALHVMKLRGGTVLERERTVIERQVSHLTRLVDDLLDVSRIARGKVELKREIVEIAEVVVRAIEVVSPALEQRSQLLRLEVPRTGLAVDGDIARLSQIMSNLLANAAKYTPPNGQITVTAETDGPFVVLRVRDNGIGIRAEALPRIFDLFEQGAQTSDRAEGGLGLGLSIVRSLVERHGGQVWAESDGPGRGSEFSVRLPLAQRPTEPPTSPGPAPAPVQAHRRARILIVDDNEDAAEMLATALRLKGHAALVAHDGPTALGYAAGADLDAAFLDIGLPAMDGYELAARLRALPGLSQLRLIAVTGYGQESDLQRSVDAGFHHHIVKPVDLGALDLLLADVARTS